MPKIIVQNRRENPIVVPAPFNVTLRRGAGKAFILSDMDALTAQNSESLQKLVRLGFVSVTQENDVAPIEVQAAELLKSNVASPLSKPARSGALPNMEVNERTNTDSLPALDAAEAPKEAEAPEEASAETETPAEGVEEETKEEPVAASDAGANEPVELADQPEEPAAEEAKADDDEEEAAAADDDEDEETAPVEPTEDAEKPAEPEAKTTRWGRKKKR